MLLDHLHDIISFNPPLPWRRYVVHDHRLAHAAPARISLRREVANDALLSVDPVSSRRGPGGHFRIASVTPSRTAVASARDYYALFLVLVRADEAPTIAEHPEEPDQEQEAEHAAEDYAHDCAGCGSRIEALVDCWYGDDAALFIWVLSW